MLLACRFPTRPPLHKLNAETRNAYLHNSNVQCGSVCCHIVFCQITYDQGRGRKVCCVRMHGYELWLKLPGQTMHSWASQIDLITNSLQSEISPVSNCGQLVWYVLDLNQKCSTKIVFRESTNEECLTWFMSTLSIINNKKISH